MLYTQHTILEKLPPWYCSNFHMFDRILRYVNEFCAFKFRIQEYVAINS